VWRNSSHLKISIMNIKEFKIKSTLRFDLMMKLASVNLAYAKNRQLNKRVRPGIETRPPEDISNDCVVEPSDRK
jgi:hypothetical protein